MIGLSRQARDKEYITFDVLPTGTFDPAITTLQGVARFDLGGLIKTSNSFSETLTGGLKSCTLWIRELSFLNDFDLSSDGLSGTLDLSNATNGLGGDFWVQTNPNLTSIINPTTSKVFTFYYAFLCDLTGNLDVSGLSGLGGSFIVQGNPNLTSITNPTSSQVFALYYAYNCNLTGTLDLSGLSGLGGNFRVYANPNLTSIINPSSSQAFTFYWAYSCNLGYIDFTTLTNMTSVNNSSIQLHNNNMTAAEVNQILVDLDNLSITGTFTGRSIQIDGTNAAPDGTSGGFDGLTAKANLIAKNFTVTTN